MGRGRSFSEVATREGAAVQKAPPKVQFYRASDLPSRIPCSGAPRVSASTVRVRVGSAASPPPSPRDVPGCQPRAGCRWAPGQL